jgi:hypothetical protein
MGLRQIVDEFPQSGADLISEVRRRGADEGIDVVAGRLSHHGGRSLPS